MPSWYVYMVRCADGSLYTGIATDPARRVREHNGDDRLAARYTRARRPVRLVFLESHPSRGSAARREAVLKAMRRPKKEELIRCSDSGFSRTAGGPAARNQKP